MKLNRIERALIDNPVRGLLQRYYEGPLLLTLGNRLDGKRVLEIGCGTGKGTEIILRLFGAKEVVAFDLDPAMVEKARRRLVSWAAGRVLLGVGDATAIAVADESFDAVFDFGVIHHIPLWRKAVSEVRRVLRPAGQFYFEEVTSNALNRWAYRTFLEHPKEDRFSGHQFVAEMENQGISVAENYVHRFFGDFVMGVGTRLSRDALTSR
jgi:ubiquinone/menaquinone biosynthesis C-methylase UbiE